MAPLKQILESRMKIRFHDCDPFNHLNNSRYIDYMITARGDQLIDNYGFDIYRLAREQGIGWVSALTQVSYIIPATVMEEVTIQTRLIDRSDKSLLLEALMWNADKTVLKAVLWTKLVHFSLTTQKSLRHAPELMNFFDQVVYPLPVAGSFEERIKALRQA